MRRVGFDGLAWADFNEWGRVDQRTQKKILELIDASCREPFTGIGKPELLKHQFKGCWARRINQEHRLVYRVLEDEICKEHY